MKKIIALLVATAMSISSTAFCADSDETAISPLKKGQPAPYSGILFTPKAAASVVTEISTAQDKIRIEVAAAIASANAKKDFEKNELIAQCTADKTKLTVLLDAEKATVKIFENDIKKKESSLGSSTWFGIGAGTGVVATILIVFAVNQVSK